MIVGNFDARILANMNVALGRVCGKSPSGGRHEFRKRVAQAVFRCAKNGKTTLGALTEAGEKVSERVENNAA